MIDGTITSGDGSPAIIVDDSANGDNLSITAWKIDNVPENDSIQGSIHYFIHATQPTIAGAGISLHEQDGTAWGNNIEWAEKNGTSTLKARADKNDYVYVKLTIPEGYRLKGAYIDDNHTVLSKGNDGYYFIMPEGGGITVNMELELIPVDPEGPDVPIDPVNPINPVNPVNPSDDDFAQVSVDAVQEAAFVEAVDITEGVLDITDAGILGAGYDSISVHIDAGNLNDTDKFKIYFEGPADALYNPVLLGELTRSESGMYDFDNLEGGAFRIFAKASDNVIIRYGYDEDGNPTIYLESMPEE